MVRVALNGLTDTVEQQGQQKDYRVELMFKNELHAVHNVITSLSPTELQLCLYCSSFWPCSSNRYFTVSLK